MKTGQTSQGRFPGVLIYVALTFFVNAWIWRSLRPEPILHALYYMGFILAWAVAFAACGLLFRRTLWKSPISDRRSFYTALVAVIIYHTFDYALQPCMEELAVQYHRLRGEMGPVQIYLGDGTQHASESQGLPGTAFLALTFAIYGAFFSFIKLPVAALIFYLTMPRRKNVDTAVIAPAT